MKDTEKKQPTEQVKQTVADIIIGLWNETADELNDYTEELNEITERFITTAEFAPLWQKGQDPRKAGITKLFQMFYIGVTKGLDLADRISNL